jgi:hypothetical protein
MLTVPNILWLKRKPAGYTAAGESRVLSAFEKAAGRVTCARCFSLCARCCRLRMDALWLRVSFAHALYEGWWARNF